ncbi:MAG: alpha/beta hydrolase [Candidatus Woesearchaeota archaeon]
MLADGRYYGSIDNNLFVRISGNGTPVIIIEPGLGSLSIEWWQIQEELSKIGTVITYDRAGYGESPKAKTPRTSTNIIMELFNMLCNTQLQGPYLFIGHSIGGLYIQHFAKLFPRHTAGIVLVDSFTTKIFEFDTINAPKYQEFGSLSSRMNNIKKLSELDAEQFNKTIAYMLSGLYEEYPQVISDQLKLYQSDMNFYKTIIDEYENLGESIKIIETIDTFPKIPLYVLCRDYQYMIELSKSIGIPAEEARIVEEMWIQHNKDLLNLSPDNEFYIIKDSDHNLHLSNPRSIIDITKKMIKNIV